MSKQLFQVLRSLLVCGRAIFISGKVSRCNHTALLAIAVGLESVYSWFAPVQMARTLTCMHVETVFPVLEELSMAILQTIYLRTFLMSPLHPLTQKMWILIYYKYMPYFSNFGATSLCVIVLMAIFNFWL